MMPEIALLRFYRSEFERLKVGSRKGGVALEHCAWMIEEALKMYTEGVDLSKINRWIGFVRGVCWKEGIYSIDDLRSHVIASKAQEHGTYVMSRPFDFFHVLFLHSGLKGWEVESGDPENFLLGAPVTFVQRADPQFIQRAIFTLDAKNNVVLTINDRVAIRKAHIAYVRFLYAKEPFARHINFLTRTR